MRVAVYYNNNDIRIAERPQPKIGEGELLVRVRASGICGTDVMEWYRIKKAPRIFGHEIAGDIVESKSKKYSVGQRVFVSHHVPCNTCTYCRAGNHTACDALHAGNYDPGGYSEMVRVPKENAERGTYVLPDHVTYEEGTMIEPLACVVRAQRITGVNNTYTVLVLGCGVSGLMNIQLAKHLGAHVIATDINHYRLQKAQACGADRIVDVAKEKLSLKADRVIICTGARQAVDQAFSCIDKKGTILFFAISQDEISLPMVDFWRNEWSITSSYGAAPVDLREALELIAHNTIPVKGLITHTLPLADIQEGYQLILRAQDSLKVVLIP